MTKLSKVVVVGSGVGGLCAAAAVSPHAARVEIYCKDLRPEEPVARKSVPQGCHISILLQAGLNNLESLFPNFRSQLVKAGAVQIPAGTGQQIYEFGRWQPERELGLTFLGLSRPLLEHQIYLAVRALPNIAIFNGTRIDTLLFDAAGKVIGVETEPQGKTVSIAADLVIDACGVGGRLFEQIMKRTSQTLETDSRDIGVFYSTAHFTKPNPLLEKKENILILPEPGRSNIGGSLIDIERNQWCISLHGRNNATPPANYDEWMNVAKSLPDLRIWQRAACGNIIGDIHTFKKPTSYWRHFEKISMPEGYLPIGDTISSVNPIFGQGITVASGHAEALRRILAEGDVEREFSRTYLEKAAQWSSLAWRKTKTHDEQFSKIKSMPEEKINMLRELARARHQRLTEDPQLHLTQVQQSQMLL